MQENVMSFQREVKVKADPYREVERELEIANTVREVVQKSKFKDDPEVIKLMQELDQCEAAVRLQLPLFKTMLTAAKNLGLDQKDAYQSLASQEAGGLYFQLKDAATALNQPKQSFFGSIFGGVSKSVAAVKVGVSVPELQALLNSVETHIQDRTKPSIMNFANDKLTLTLAWSKLVAKVGFNVRDMPERIKSAQITEMPPEMFEKALERFKTAVEVKAPPVAPAPRPS
jgi:hypothetical protein